MGTTATPPRPRTRQLHSASMVFSLFGTTPHGNTWQDNRCAQFDSKPSHGELARLKKQAARAGYYNRIDFGHAKLWHEACANFSYTYPAPPDNIAGADIYT